MHQKHLKTSWPKDQTAIDDPQNDNGDILNTEDPTSDSIYDNTIVDDDTNNADDENAEVMADIMTAKENFDDCYGIRTSHYNMRPRKERDYLHLHTMIEGIAMTQYPLHMGIKVFGDADKRAVIEEPQQLHEWQVIEPFNADKISKTEKSDALE